MADVLLQGSFDAAHQRRYAHVPFQVPASIRALHVAYDYSDRISSDPLLSGGNTLDIGLFDPRGIEPSSPGFRGWSGSHKLSFSVTETWATPAYLPGPIQPGTWHVLLGPYKVGPNGLDYRVEINFGLHPGAAEPRSLDVHAQRPALAAAAEPNWLRGDLHCHTRYSDGDSWPTDMLADAVTRGLDFLGVTDHNQVGHHAEYAAARGESLPIVLPGVEVTTYGGHWNAWGTATWWDFREPTEAATSAVMRAAAESGALVSVNHPKPFGPPWEYPNATGYHAIEVWNGHRTEWNRVSQAWWDEQLRAGRRIVGLGGSDTHALKPGAQDRLGSPTTWAQVRERSVSGVLEALRGGRAFVSRDPSGPQLYLERAGPNIRVRAVDAPGSVLGLISSRGVEATSVVDSADWSSSVRPTDGAGYVRAQLMDEYGQLLALTNPVYL
jgi:PHP domain